MGDMVKAEQYVERALQNWEITRGSDRHLIVAVWYLQNPNWQDDAKNFILNKAVMPETITRHRRKLQEKGKYLPEEKITEHRYNKFKRVRGGDLSVLS